MINPQKKEYDEALYLKGFKDGFENSNKLCAAHSADLLEKVENANKETVREFIAKLGF